MEKNKLSPIEQLRQEKRELKILYLKDEQNLSEDWEYLTNNLSSLALNSLLGGVTGMFSKQKKEEEPGLLNHLLQGKGSSVLFNSLTTVLPIAWGIAQPLLLKFAIKKIKGLFTSKKKKK